MCIPVLGYTGELPLRSDITIYRCGGYIARGARARSYIRCDAGSNFQGEGRFKAILFMTKINHTNQKKRIFYTVQLTKT